MRSVALAMADWCRASHDPTAVFGPASSTSAQADFAHALPPNEWFDMKVRVEGEKAEMSINGSPVFSARQPVQFPSGLCGFWSQNTTTKFRQVRLSALAGAEIGEWQLALSPKSQGK